MKTKRCVAYAAIGIFFICTFAGFFVSRDLKSIYKQRASVVVLDRHGAHLDLRPNQHGYYAFYADDTTEIPEYMKDALIAKEDRYFYFHPGVNPLSLMRHGWDVFEQRSSASSTITLQLVKVLYGHENDRTFTHKLHEVIGALSLEIFSSKEDILLMYLNSVFLGNSTQGIISASQYYFGKEPDQLTYQEIISLLATLNNPSGAHPFSHNNTAKSTLLINSLDLEVEPLPQPSQSERERRIARFQVWRTTQTMFEAENFLSQMEPGNLPEDVHLTLDHELTKKIRSLSYRHMQRLFPDNAFNAAVVVISLADHSILSLVGSPDPTITDTGYQIDMTRRPRHVGSAIKPLLYAKGFEKGLRPSTLVSDREYRYSIGSGYALYPKNYDYTYNGTVSLQYALSNSLNVPTVKVLEHIGVDDFSHFLREDLGFSPHRELEAYGLGIALGDLEMTLLELTHALSTIPDGGTIYPIQISDDISHSPQGLALDEQRSVISPAYTQLTHAILSDRLQGVDQFGLTNNLSLPFAGYGVKTGTSEGYHDSLTVGYSADYVVGVWVGNTDFTPMDGVSGERGAGRIWHDVMTLLEASDYNTSKKVETPLVTSTSSGGTLLYTLADDQEKDTISSLDKISDLIFTPHDGDVFLWEKGMTIPFTGPEMVTWSVNDVSVAQSDSHDFKPDGPGTYKIHASNGAAEQEHTITIKPPLK